MGLIGKRFKIKLDTKHLISSIQKASKSLIKEYPKYVNVNGKDVIVLSIENDTNVKVGLVEKGLFKDNYWLIISNRWLVACDSSCMCSTRVLMCRGCICGAFQVEKNSETKPKALKDVLPDPW